MATAGLDTDLEVEAASGTLLETSQKWRSRRSLRFGLLTTAGLLAAIGFVALVGARHGRAASAAGVGASGELLVAAEDAEIPDQEVPHKEVSHKEVSHKEVSHKEVSHKEVADKEVADKHKEVSDKEVSDKEVSDKEVSDKEVAHQKIPDQGMGFPINNETPRLFCWSVMNCANPNEIDTMKGQLRVRIGIFGCDNVAVISGCKMILGDGHKLPNGSHVQVKTWYNPAAPVPMGNLQAGDDTNSYKNSRIFIDAWNILVKSKAVFGHDWTIKCDPDAVFFAHRARWHLKRYPTDKPAFVRNCNWHGKSVLYGAVEVVNEAALKQYDIKGNTCMYLDWMHWGEDEWLWKCMMFKLGAVPLDDFELVGDHRCMSAECEDTWRVGFHDYKSWQMYYNCYNRSTNAEKQKMKIKDSDNFCCTFAPDMSNPCGTCGSKVVPGSGFCGTNKWNCKNCGSAHWCKREQNGNAVLDD